MSGRPYLECLSGPCIQALTEAPLKALKGVEGLGFRGLGFRVFIIGVYIRRTPRPVIVV